MVSMRGLVGTTSSRSAIPSLLWSAWNQQSEVALRLKVRRMFTTPNRDAWNSAATGTLIPHPYNESPMTVRTMIGDGTRAAYIATSRLTANTPDIAVLPLSMTNKLAVGVSERAGEQERLDAELWHANGGDDAQWQASWAKSVGGAAFWLTLPRDADFGLPDRAYYPDDDPDLSSMKAAGKIAAAPYGAREDGSLVWAEHGDVWAARRKEAAHGHAQDGRNLFTLSTYPRDMVLKERDREAKDLKWAAIVEEIPVSDCAPGSDFSMSVAHAKGVDSNYLGSWGIFWDEKHEHIIGGISQGGPLNSSVGTYDAFTLIRYFDREEMVILVAPRGSIQGATEIYRGTHGCRVQGSPACPVVEDPFYRTDVNTAGQEYSTVLDPVFAWLAPINQMLTLKSLVALYNSTPRLVGELQDGVSLADDDGQPIAGNSFPVPGLSANQIAWFQGTVTQLLIKDEGMTDVLKICLEELAKITPTFGTESSGSDAPGWAVQMRIQEQQEPFREPNRNGCQTISGIVQRWHGWLRQLDTPIYFFPTQGKTRDQRARRGLIEFDPQNLVDSIIVTQRLNTPAEATVNEQIALQKWQAQLIDDEEFYELTGEQDVREAVIRRWVQMVTNYIMDGTLPAPRPGSQPLIPSMVQIIGDAVRGQVHYEMIQTNDNYAIGVASNMAQQVRQQQAMQTAPGQPPQEGMPTGQGNIADAVGAAVPGVGMAPSLPQQLGNNVPGGPQAQQPVLA